MLCQMDALKLSNKKIEDWKLSEKRNNKNYCVWQSRPVFIKKPSVKTISCKNEHNTLEEE